MVREETTMQKEGQKARVKKEIQVTPRYPQGCPIKGHGSYGCNCNPVVKR